MSRSRQRSTRAKLMRGVQIVRDGFAGLIAGENVSGALGALLSQPAVVSVPIAFVTMIGVSLLDSAHSVDAAPVMLALHVPEGLGLEQLAEEPAPAEPAPV